VSTAPVLYVSHGAATFSTQAGDPLNAALLRTSSWLTGVQAIVVVSAHDVRRATTLGVAQTISMWHDHPAASGLSWSAPGAVNLVERIATLFDRAGVSHEQGAPLLDHGAWVPLRALDPNGIRPIVTVSLRSDMDPAFHVALGQALGALRSEGVLILCSGGLTHNQAEFRRSYFAHTGGASGSQGHAVAEAAVALPSQRFARAMLNELTKIGPERTTALLRAPAHPDFRFCHPTLDHWLPVLVAAGAAGADPGVVLHQGFQYSLSTAMVGFGQL
jgi:4,5-DOPA dioxygenase extradiol